MSRRLEELRRYAVGWLHPVGYATGEGLTGAADIYPTG